MTLYRHGLLFLAVGLLSTNVLAGNCPCPAVQAEALVDQATYVFQGRLNEIRIEKKTGERRLFFEIFDTFKGDWKGATGILDETNGTPCMIPFKEDEIYLVYARWELGLTVIKPCSGTKIIEKTPEEEAQSLGPGDEFKRKLYRQIQEMCMGRRDTLCCLDSLKAMRAGDSLPEPEEGCPENMKPDRLRCLGSLVWCVPIVATR